METLQTIIANFEKIWYAPKDWSIHGGILWLTFYLLCCVVGLIFQYFKEMKGKRQAHKLALYRDAEESGQARLGMMKKNGYIEKWVE